MTKILGTGEEHRARHHSASDNCVWHEINVKHDKLTMYETSCKNIVKVPGGFTQAMLELSICSFCKKNIDVRELATPMNPEIIKKEIVMTEETEFDYLIHGITKLVDEVKSGRMKLSAIDKTISNDEITEGHSNLLKNADENISRAIKHLRAFTDSLPSEDYNVSELIGTLIVGSNWLHPKMVRLEKDLRRQEMFEKLSHKEASTDDQIYHLQYLGPNDVPKCFICGASVNPVKGYQTEIHPVGSLTAIADEMAMVLRGKLYSKTTRRPNVPTVFVYACQNHNSYLIDFATEITNRSSFHTTRSQKTTPAYDVAFAFEQVLNNLKKNHLNEDQL